MNQIFPPPRARDAEADTTVSTIAHAGLLEAASRASQLARTRAVDLDIDGAFPSDDVVTLAEEGLLAAPLPTRLGGHGLVDPGACPLLARVLMLIGGGSLPLGRLYEGHVNALKLIATYGKPDQLSHFAKLVRDGAMLAVWNTEVADGVRLLGRGEARQLQGRKVFASGAGFIEHPLITARDDDGQLLMVVPTVDDQTRGDLSSWRPHGMHASASGAVDFTGLPIAPVQVIGGPDDFHKQPMFSAGAWRFAAVQTGGIGAVLDAARAHLVSTGRADDPHQRARMGSAALAVQTARLWVLDAARIADDETASDEARVAYVNLARSAVERAGLDVLELAQRSVGLAGFQRAHPLERLGRDLATYLRQPNPDKALGDAAAHVLASRTPILDLWPWP